MNVNVDIRSNRVIVRCSGRLDAASSPEFERAVAPLLAHPDVRPAAPIILDLEGVDYISSAGIRVLLQLWNTSGAALPKEFTGMAPLRLSVASPQVQKTLTMVGLWSELTRWTISAQAEAPKEPGIHYDGLLVERVREAFPAPISDPRKDAYFVHTISNALDDLDDLKTERPYLGKREPLDYEKARHVAFPDRMASMKETMSNLVHYLDGMTIWGHPRTQLNVVPPSSIPSIIGQLFGLIYNPNIIWDEGSHRVAEAEVEVTGMCGSLVGYDTSKSGGVFTFGGTGTIFYGVKIGIEKAQPGAFQDGINREMKVVASEAAHYAKFSALGWLGLGLKNFVAVPSDEDNAMGLTELEATLRDLLDRGTRIACIIATMGTTDAFGIDNLDFIVRLRDRLVAEYCLDYRPHIHADAVIGWAWAVFNDYDFTGNPMGFEPRTLRSLWDASLGMRALKLADSIGFDFHKTGYTPYISSLFLSKEQGDLQLISRDKALMPYLFQYGNYHPGVFTMETSRSGGAVLSALANLTFFGKEGYRALLGHIVSVAESLRERLEASQFACTVNDYNYGPVTLFRVYPDGVQARSAYLHEKTDPLAGDELQRHNDFNRQVFQGLLRQMDEGRGMALSLTDCYRKSASGLPIVALKSFVMSPFTDPSAMDHLMKCLTEARAEAMRGASA